MAHTTYTVGPMPGDSKRWRVLANGRQVSKHNTKRNAVEKATDLGDGVAFLAVVNVYTTVCTTRTHEHRRLQRCEVCA